MFLGFAGPFSWGPNPPPFPVALYGRGPPASSGIFEVFQIPFFARPLKEGTSVLFSLSLWFRCKSPSPKGPFVVPCAAALVVFWGFRFPHPLAIGFSCSYYFCLFLFFLALARIFILAFVTKLSFSLIYWRFLSVRKKKAVGTGYLVPPRFTYPHLCA